MMIEREKPIGGGRDRMPKKKEDSQGFTQNHQNQSAAA